MHCTHGLVKDFTIWNAMLSMFIIPLSVEYETLLVAQKSAQSGSASVHELCYISPGNHSEG